MQNGTTASCNIANNHGILYNIKCQYFYKHIFLWCNLFCNYMAFTRHTVVEFDAKLQKLTSMKFA